MDFNTKRKLSNGYEIPILGYGTWRTPDGEVAVDSVAEAIRVGYRHIDTAARYENEVSVGEGIRSSGVDRRELFVTSKLWNTERGYDKAMRAFEKSLDDLGLEYLDLYHDHFFSVYGCHFVLSLSGISLHVRYGDYSMHEKRMQ